MSTTTPVIRELSLDECEAMLRRHMHGRLAFAFRDRVDIEPIHFVYDDGWIIGRTGPGTKLTVLHHAPWVAFEVDDAESMFSWQSVVAKGTAYMLEPDGTAYDESARERAIDAIRRILPEAFTAQDPVPYRSLLFRIHVDELQGRACSPGSD